MRLNISKSSSTSNPRFAVSSDNLTYDLDKKLPGIETPAEDFWVFGYGSLIWNPGFSYKKAAPVRVKGYQRQFCLQSTRYRGTKDYYGLVLALAATEQHSLHCDGVAFQVAKEQAADTCAYLYEREMQHYSYIPTWVDADFKACAPQEFEGSSAIEPILAFVIDPTKPTYRGEMNLDKTVERIAKAVGPRGSNRDYLFETVAALHAQSLQDAELEELLRLVDARIKDDER